MEDCAFCRLIKDCGFKHKLMEDKHAIAFMPESPFRKGNCTISLKRHLNSISA